MSVKPENEAAGGAADTLKLALAAVFAVAGVAGFYWFAARPLYERVGMIVAGLVIGTVLAFTTEAGRGFWGFVEGSRTEVRKMVWPTRQETLQTTLALVVFVIILGVIMLGIDWALAWAVEELVGAGA
jgi:preprotein translocase subunit SecE